MAREESDREDLLREATALVQRAEIQLDGLPGTSFVGFRRDGCFSFYRTADEAYHFNTSGELRRAHIDGQLIKAEKGKLVGLTRQREADQVALLRDEFDQQRTTAFMQQLRLALSTLSDQLHQSTLQVVGKVDAEGDPVASLAQWIQSSLDAIEIADSPHAG